MHHQLFTGSCHSPPRAHNRANSTLHVITSVSQRRAAALQRSRAGQQCRPSSPPKLAGSAPSSSPPPSWALQPSSSTNASSSASHSAPSHDPPPRPTLHGCTSVSCPSSPRPTRTSRRGGRRRGSRVRRRRRGTLDVTVHVSRSRSVSAREFTRLDLWSARWAARRRGPNKYCCQEGQRALVQVLQMFAVPAARMVI